MVPLRILRSLFLLSFCCLLPVALLSCDSGGSTSSSGTASPDTFSVEKGSFTATIIDDDEDNTDVSGGAVFGTTTDLDSAVSTRWDEAFIIYMLDGKVTVNTEGERRLVSPAKELRLLDDEATVPNTGTVTLRRWDLTSLSPNFSAGSPDAEIEITSKSDDTLEGTFDFGSPSGINPQFKGSFTAKRVDNIGSVPCKPACADD